MPRMDATAAAAAGFTPAIVTAPQPAFQAPAPSGFNAPPGVPPPRVASFGDEFVSTGLANNFNGRVLAGWLLPRKYSKGAKAGVYSLTYELIIQADDTSIGKNGVVVEYYKVDALNQWVPSRSEPVWDVTTNQWVYIPAGTIPGTNVAADLDVYALLHKGERGFPSPVPNESAILPPDDWRGFMAIPGKENNRDNFMKNTKFDHFKKELKKVQYREKAPHINWGDTRQFLVGVYGKWVRIPYEWEGGNKPDDAQQIDTLCLAEILDLGPISGSQGAPAMVAAPTFTLPPTPVPAPTFAVPATTPATMTMTPQQIAAGVTEPAAVVAPAQMAMPTAVAASIPTASRTDPAAISAAANEILTALVKQRGSLTKQEAGVALMEGVNARGLDGAAALVQCLNNNDWMVGDDRGFGYIPEKGTMVPLP